MTRIKPLLSDNVTVCIFAFNEEKRIAKCILNFSQTFNVLVVDNYSTDGTCDLVKSLGVRCIKVKNPNFIETPEVMTPVMNACDTEYILIASVSEFVPLSLQRLYADVANSRSHDIVRAYRASITAGKPVPISGSPNKKAAGELRFLRKDSVNYENNPVHGRGRPMCKPGRILKVVADAKLHFYQFRDYDCSRTESAHCRYDDVLSVQRYNSGQRFTILGALYNSLRVFISSYIWHGSYRFGMLGFIHSYYRWQMEFTVWLRIWELEHSYSIAHVIELNNSIRNQMESEFFNQISDHANPEISN